MSSCRTSAEKPLALAGPERRLVDDQGDKPLWRLPLHRELRPIHLVVGDHVCELIRAQLPERLSERGLTALFANAAKGVNGANGTTRTTSASRR